MLILMFRRLSPRSRAITGLVLLASSWLSRRRQRSTHSDAGRSAREHAAL